MNRLHLWMKKILLPAALLAVPCSAWAEATPWEGLIRLNLLCPYPQVAKYKGTGSIDEAQNFVCAAP